MALPSGNIFKRDDTLFGICEGLGQDLGVNPLWIRLAFLPVFFIFPMPTIAAYLTIGLLVLLSRTIFPAPTAQQVVEAPAVKAESAPEAPARDYSLAA
jgi:phage shock protein C